MLDLLPKRAVAIEPSKKWRNRWVRDRAGLALDMNGNVYRHTEANVPIWGAHVWPSKEIAEQNAIEAIAEDRACGRYPAQWLGAFEVSE